MHCINIVTAVKWMRRNQIELYQKA